MKSVKGMTGYSEAALSHAFDKVIHRVDWKAPIDARIDRADQWVVAAAIRFYTATEACVTDDGQERLRVQSVGYRGGPLDDVKD